ncbi:MAG: GTPase HflX [Thermostichales cyanobacterium HHBFW_bins_127]
MAQSPHWHGLKPHQHRQLERLANLRQPPNTLITWDLAQRLGSLTSDLGPLTVLISRRGQILKVALGSPFHNQLAPLDLPRQGSERLSGIRCITTQPHRDPPGRQSLLAMALQRLDALVVLAVTGSGFRGKKGQAAGYVEQGYLAYLVPQRDPDSPRWWHSDLLPLARLCDWDLAELVAERERAFADGVSVRVTDRERVILVGIQQPQQSHQDLVDRLQELTGLVESAGGQVIHTLWQRRDHLHTQTLIGAGKVQELALCVQDLGANLVVFDRELSPSQGRTLEEQLGVRVVDRNEVILDIFAQRARSQAGQLQVELAQLQYLLPRLVGRGKTMSRLGGGIGTRGPGETQLEMERRAIQRRISKLKAEVELLAAQRQRQRLQREQSRLPLVALVGYTNAGKSTLLNTLTHANVYVADQLFATLDPTTRRYTTPQGSLLLTDTVGFLTELPAALVNAFRSTLEEVTEADVLLHVVDLAHPQWENHIAAVEEILHQMEPSPGPRQLVFNKIDRVDPEWLEDVQRLYPQGLFISATRGQGLGALRELLERLISRQAHPKDCPFAPLKPRSQTAPDS